MLKVIKSKKDIYEYKTFLVHDTAGLEVTLDVSYKNGRVIEQVLKSNLMSKVLAGYNTKFLKADILNYGGRYLFLDSEALALYKAGSSLEADVSDKNWLTYLNKGFDIDNLYYYHSLGLLFNYRGEIVPRKLSGFFIVPDGSLDDAFILDSLKRNPIVSSLSKQLCETEYYGYYYNRVDNYIIDFDINLPEEAFKELWLRVLNHCQNKRLQNPFYVFQNLYSPEKALDNKLRIDLLGISPYFTNTKSKKGWEVLYPPSKDLANVF